MENVKKSYYKPPIIKWITCREDVIRTSEASGEEFFDVVWID